MSLKSWLARVAVYVAVVSLEGGATLVACGGVSILGSGDGGDSAVPARDGGGPETGRRDAEVDGMPAPGEGGAGDTGGLPSLVELAIQPSSLTLVPAFSPTIHDYYVSCAAGSNAASVTMRASSGADSELLQPTLSAAKPEQRVSVTVHENDAIVAAATKGSQSVQYWVRCLPHDFPTVTVQPHPKAGTPPPGYYLIGSYMPPGYAIVLDANAVPVWYRSVSSGAGNVQIVQVDSIAYAALGPPVAWSALDFSPFSTNPVSASGGVPLDMHELVRLPDGDYVAISTPILTGVDLTGLKVDLPDGGAESFGPNSVIEDCRLVEFTPSGSVVWTWSASDHFDPVQDSTFPLLTSLGAPDGGPVVDPFHCDSIDVDPANGNFLVSARLMDSVFYLERPSGKVLWKMGGAMASKDLAVYIPVTPAFHRQHDARLQSGWSCSGGQISMFDNETGGGAPGRAIVYDVAVGGRAGCDAGVNGATVSWQYAGVESVLSLGSFRISSDGSRVVGWGLPGRLTKFAFSEVDEAHHDLLDFSFTSPNATYRAIKVPASDLDLAAMRASAGLP